MLAEADEILVKVTPNQRALVITVSGYFSANLLDQFRSAYESKPKFERYAVNFKRCLGIDSSGLGMLLLLRDFAAVEQSNLLITECSQTVLKILDCSNFNQLFTIR